MRSLISFVLFIVLAVFLFSTCPDKQEHVDALSDEVTAMIAEKLGNSAMAEQISTSPEMQELIAQFGPSMIDVDNYFVFSLGKINLSGEEQTVSLGIGGHVFTFSDKIVQAAGELATKAGELMDSAKDSINDWLNN